MRTKTLLLAAAALAVSLVSSQAQVYSGVVGYYNVTIPAHSFALLGNQLINGSDVTQTNNDINTVVSSGLVSDPNGPPSGTNSAYYQWTGSSYNTYYYFNVNDGAAYGVNGSTAGWYDQAGNPASVSLNQGLSAFLRNPSGSSMTVTLVGSVLQGTNKIAIPSGFSLLSLPQPISTNADVSAIGLPDSLLSSDPNGPPSGTNDIYYQWTGSSYNSFYYFNIADGAAYGVNGSTAGFYDQAGNPLPPSSYPQVGQGFILKHFGSAITWTNSFIPQ